MSDVAALGTRALYCIDTRLGGLALNLIHTPRSRWIVVGTGTLRVVKVLNDFIETQPVDPLATNLALLQMDAFAGRQDLGTHIGCHDFTFRVVALNCKRAN
jgi:hypothetical protein